MWHPPQSIRHVPFTSRWPNAAEAAAARLFSPLSAGRLQLADRTWVPAMVPWRATDDGFVTSDVLQWYERFAQGQPGAIVVEATGVRDIPSGPLLRIGDDRFVPGLRQLADTVRQGSGGRTRVFIQIIDFLSIRRRPTRETFLRRYLTVTDAHKRAVASLGSDLNLRYRRLRSDPSDATARLWASVTVRYRRRNVSRVGRRRIDRKSMIWMKTRVRPPLPCRTVSASWRSPGTKRSSPIRSSGPLGMSRTPVASTTIAPGCPCAKRSYHCSTSLVTNPSSVARHGTIAGTHVRSASCSRPALSGLKSRAAAASAAFGQRDVKGT